MEWISRNDWPGLVGSADLDGVTVDIGAGDGGFTELWQRQTPSRSHAVVDLWAPQAYRDWPHFDNQQSSIHWEGVRSACESAVESFAGCRMIQSDGIDASAQFADGSIDSVWLDASHNYSFVRGALEAWWPKLKPGGIVGGTSCINSFHKFDEGGFMWIRTRQAVEDFAKRREIHVYTDQEQWPSYLLSKPKSERRITVVSGSTMGVPWTGMVRGNHEEYCAAHGLNYVWMNFDDLERHPVWGKIFALASVIESSDSDWVVWLDADAVFVDFSKALEQFLVAGADAILPEWIGDDKRRRPSSGVMFWRRNERASEILKKIWKCPEGHHGYSGEEDAMRDVLRGNTDLCSGCLLVDHRHFNSMMSSWIGWNDSRDFIIHIGQVEDENRFGVLRDLVDSVRTF